MAIQPVFGAIPYERPRSLMEVISQKTAESEALKSKASERAFREAQTRKLTMGIEHPELSRAGLPPLAQQRAYVESLKKAFGADSPRVIEAQQDLDLQQHMAESKMQYQEALTKALPSRFLTPVGKAFMEKARIDAGFSPTGEPLRKIRPQVAGTTFGTPTLENKLSNMSKEDLIKAKDSPFGSEASAIYALYLSKLAGLGDNIKKLPYASAIEKSLSLMLPYRASMAYYSGVAGRARYAKDLVEAQRTGKITPELRDYTNFTTIASSSLASQIRQYYGDSISPSVEKRLDNITNPATWKNSPELALTSLDALENILRAEIKIRKDLVTHPSFLTKEAPRISPMGEKLKKIGMTFTEVSKLAHDNGIPMANVESFIDDMIAEQGGA